MSNTALPGARAGANHQHNAPAATRPIVDGRDVARDIVLERLRLSKRTLVHMLNEGSRDYEVMHDLVKEVVNLQMAADQLGHAMPLPEVAS